jgi:hypothetical protein
MLLVLSKSLSFQIQPIGPSSSGRVDFYHLQKNFLANSKLREHMCLTYDQWKYLASISIHLQDEKFMFTHSTILLASETDICPCSVACRRLCQNAHRGALVFFVLLEFKRQNVHVGFVRLTIARVAAAIVCSAVR